MFVKDDFKNISFPIHGVEGNLRSKVPQLKNIPAFKKAKSPEADQMIKYTIYCYDKKSPVFKMFKDIESRKKQAAKLAGISINKTNTNNYFNLKKKELLNMVHEFLIYQNNRKYSLYISSQEMFYELQYQIVKRLEGESEKDLMASLEKKSKISQTLDELLGRIEKYEADLFDHDNKENVSKLKNNSIVTPEDYVSFNR